MVNESVFNSRSAIGNSVQQVSNLPSPRFIKSHLPLQLLPDALNTVMPKVRAPTLFIMCVNHHIFSLSPPTFRPFTWLAIPKICVYPIIITANWCMDWSAHSMTSATFSSRTTHQLDRFGRTCWPSGRKEMIRMCCS